MRGTSGAMVVVGLFKMLQQQGLLLHSKWLKVVIDITSTPGLPFGFYFLKHLVRHLLIIHRYI